ncbi:MAG: DUF2147 domain-containing protein [Xanthobacteraceae bacterium]
MKAHVHHSRLAAMVTIIVTSVASLSTIANAEEPWGTWTRPSTGTQLNFYNCDGKLCAKIVAVKDQSRISEVGTVIMAGAAKSGDNEWRGDLLNIDDGKTYSGVVTLQGPKALRLDGCVLGGAICRGETWERVN